MMGEDILNGYLVDSINRILIADTLLLTWKITQQDTVIKSQERVENLMLEQNQAKNGIIAEKDRMIRDRDTVIAKLRKHKIGAIIAAVLIAIAGIAL